MPPAVSSGPPRRVATGITNSNLRTLLPPYPDDVASSRLTHIRSPACSTRVGNPSASGTNGTMSASRGSRSNRARTALPLQSQIHPRVDGDDHRIRDARHHRDRGAEVPLALRAALHGNAPAARPHPDLAPSPRPVHQLDLDGNADAPRDGEAPVRPADGEVCGRGSWHEGVEGGRGRSRREVDDSGDVEGARSVEFHATFVARRRFGSGAVA